MHQIIGAKLPSKRQALQVFFFDMRSRAGKPDSTVSARLVVKEIFVFWDKARIPTRHEPDCVAKLLKLYNVWQNLRKHANRTTAAHEKTVMEFVDALDDLFDIAHNDAMNQMKNQKDKDFLESQRKKGRPGSMIGVDRVLAAQEQRSVERKQKEEIRKRKNLEMEKCGTKSLHQHRISYRKFIYSQFICRGRQA